MKYLYYILKHINRVTNNRPEDTEEEGGYVLVLALALVVGLSTLVAQYARLTRLEQLSATASSIDANTALYVAEAVANERAAQLRRIYQLQNTPTGTPPESISNCLQNTTTGRGTGDFACQTKLFPPPAPGRSGYIGVSYVVPGSSRTITVPAGQAFAGTTALEYTHSVYALAYKEVDAGTKQLGNNTKASAVLQMDVRTRLVPMFQFAAFYREDLEILPGPQMVLNGPVHTNGDLYLGSGNLLRIRGLVSTLRDIYNRRKNDGSTYAEGRVQIDNSAGTAINLLSGGTGSTNPTTNPMDPDRVRQTWGGRVRVRMQEPIQVPTATGIFDKANGDYWKNADLRIIFTPRSTANNNYRQITNNNFPFDITVIKRNPDGSVNSTYSLTNEQKMSLLQPVLVGADLANIPANVTVGSTNVTNPFHICTPVRVENSNRTVSPALRLGNTTYSQLGQWYQALNVTQKNAVRTVAQDWLLKEIHHANSNVAIRYSLLDIPVKDVKSQDGNLYNNFATNPSNSLNNNPTLVGAFPDSQDRQGAINAIENMTAQEIAGLAQYQGTGSGSEVPGTRRCFAPAPITDVGRDAANHDTPYRFYNHREEKDLRLLQLNLESLVVWNRDGVYRDPGGGGGGGNNTHLVSANQLLFDRAPADNNAPGHSFQRLGLAARDTSHGGLVFYATMGNSTTWTPRQSPFGFAIVNGEQLPGLGTTQTYPDPTGLTFVSDQAVYVQGNYNVNTRDYHTGASENLSSPRGENEFVTRPANKQPAAFLVDTFTPLSNACINSDRTVFHAQLPVSSIPSNDRAISCSGHRDQLPKHTEFNAALLAGTDITNAPGYGYNGGLENYPRFLEDWTGREWRYRGSFVSLGIPINVSGAWGKANVYSAPLRPWDYDQDFNDARNLPPMTPQFVYLIQEAFIRSYSQPGQ